MHYVSTVSMYHVIPLGLGKTRLNLNLLCYRLLQSTYLSSGVNDLSRVLLALVLDNFAEGVLNGRIVALNKVAIDELNGQG